MLKGLSLRAPLRGLALAACAVGLGGSAASAQPVATADSLFGWIGAPGPASASFADVAYDGSERVYAGFLFDSMAQNLTATLFSTTQPPGAALTPHDLGFTVDPSVAVSIAPGLGGRYWVAVSQSEGVSETTAHLIDWSAGAGSTQVQMTGPATTFDPFVTVRDVNEMGDAVGRVGGLRGLIDSTVAGVRTVFAPADSDVFAISSDGEVLGGSGNFGSGTHVATIWNEVGIVVYQDTAPGRILSVGPPFAVGERNGHLAFWRQFHGTWTPYEIKDASAVPIEGRLNAVDSEGAGIAGGQLAEGGAIVVLLRSKQVILLDEALSLAPGTLWAVHGVDSHASSHKVAFATESTFFEAWDVTASFTSTSELVPGPGPLVVLPLLIAGTNALRTRRRQPAEPTPVSGFTRVE